MAAAVAVPLNGIELRNMGALNRAGYENTLNDLFARTNITAKTSRFGRSESTTVLTKDMLDDLLQELSVVIVGLLPTGLHIINSLILPVIITNDTRFRTRTIRYLAQLPGYVPEGGVGRLLQSTESEAESRTKPYSYGFMMSRKREDLPQGRVETSRNLVQITGGIVMNLAHMGLHALMVQPNTPDSAIAQAMYGQTALEARIINHRDNFAMIHRSTSGIPRAVLKVVEAVTYKCKVAPTVGIMPRAFKLLVNNNNQYTSFEKAGPDGPQRLWGHGAAITTVHGVSLYEAPPLPDMGFDSDTQLSSYTVLGDYAVFRKYPGMLVDDENTDNTAWRMYCQYSDKRLWLTLTDLIKKSHFLEFPMIPGANGGAAREDRMHVRVNTDRLKKAVESVGMKVEQGPQFDALATSPEGVPIAQFFNYFYFMGIRPLNAYRMEDGVICVPGMDTGFTTCSPGELARGVDVGTFMTKINWQGDQGIHIKDYTRIARMYDFRYNGTRGGCNTRIMTAEEVKTLQKRHFILANEASASMMLMVHPATSPQSIRSAPFLYTAGHGPFATSREDADGDYPYANFWSRYFGLQTAVHFQEVNTREWKGRVAPAAALFQCQLDFARTNGGIETIIGETHHGQYEDSGAQLVRRIGESLYPKVGN